MKVNNFYSYNLNERLDKVHKEAIFITRIKYYGFYISLYILDNNFVEVYYNIHNNKIEEVELIDFNNDHLYLFSASVDVSDAYKA